MILYTMFNLSSKDFSGLPHYSSMFVDYFSDKREMVLLNIVADSKESHRVEAVEVKGKKCYNIYAPKFLTQFDPILQNLIIEIIEDFKVEKVILQDYLLQEYFQIPQADNIERVFFVHLLYRGMLDCMLKEPYSDQMLSGMNGVNDMASKAWLEWKAIVESDTIICNSKFTFEQLMRFYWDSGINKKKIVVAPLGIEDEWFEDFDLPKTNKWIYFGRITAQKGIYYFMKDVQVHEDLYKKNPLICVGEGDMDNFMWRTMMYDKTVDYRGLKSPSELREILKDVKFCVFPSIYEPWGLALTEALALGKICIVNARDGGLVEQIENGVNGFVVDMYSGIIEKVNEIAKRSDLKEISNNAKKSARKQIEHFKIIDEVI